MTNLENITPSERRHSQRPHNVDSIYMKRPEQAKPQGQKGGYGCPQMGAGGMRGNY